MAAPVLAQTTGFLSARPVAHKPQRSVVGRSALKVRAGPYDEELISTAVGLLSLRHGNLIHCSRESHMSVRPLWYLTFSVWLQNKVASKGRGILAMDESNATCGKRLDSIGLENTEDNRRTYRELLISTPGLGEYISGAILFEETLYQSDSSGKTFVELLQQQNIVPGASWYLFLI